MVNCSIPIAERGGVTVIMSACDDFFLVEETDDFNMSQGGSSIDDSKTTNYSTWSSTKIQSELNGKADAVNGKGLSTEDYTTAEKEKLASVETGAQVNTVTGVKGNSEASYRTGDINITKANIGLGNVDNTSVALSEHNLRYQLR